MHRESSRACPRRPRRPRRESTACRRNNKWATGFLPEFPPDVYWPPCFRRRNEKKLAQGRGIRAFLHGVVLISELGECPTPIMQSRPTIKAAKFRCNHARQYASQAEIGSRPVPGARPSQCKEETAAGQLRPRAKSTSFRRSHSSDVRFRLGSPNRAFFAPNAHLGVVRGRLADLHFFIRQVGQLE